VWQKVTIKNGRSFLHHVVPNIVRPLKALWNEVIGFLFLSLGAIFGFSAYRYLHAGEVFRFVVAASCAFLMAWFGVSSFWRARKISRS